MARIYEKSQIRQTFLGKGAEESHYQCDTLFKAFGYFAAKSVNRRSPRKLSVFTDLKKSLLADSPDTLEVQRNLFGNFLCEVYFINFS